MVQALLRFLLNNTYSEVITDNDSSKINLFQT